MPREKSKAERARALRAKHPDMPVAEIVRRVDGTRQGVHEALTAGSAKRGRPSEGKATVLREEDLSTRALELARARAESMGVELAEVLAAAVEAGLAQGAD